jgi:hypothetical protein
MQGAASTNKQERTMDYDDDGLDDLRAEVRHQKRQTARFLAHPDPRDPYYEHDEGEEDDQS